MFLLWKQCSLVFQWLVTSFFTSWSNLNRNSSFRYTRTSLLIIIGFFHSTYYLLLCYTNTPSWSFILHPRFQFLRSRHPWEISFWHGIPDIILCSSWSTFLTLLCRDPLQHLPSILRTCSYHLNLFASTVLMISIPISILFWVSHFSPCLISISRWQHLQYTISMALSCFSWYLFSPNLHIHILLCSPQLFYITTSWCFVLCVYATKQNLFVVLLLSPVRFTFGFLAD